MPHTQPDCAQARCGAALHAAVAALCLGAAQPCEAFGDVGYLPPCATFTSCTAAVGSGAAVNARYAVTEITAGYVMPPDLYAGVTTYSAFDTVMSSAALLVLRDPPLPNPATGGFYLGSVARAQSDFSVNRAQSSPGRGVAGMHSMLPFANQSAAISIQTFAEAGSAWRDVWSFNMGGHFSATVALDGSSKLAAFAVMDPSYVKSPIAGFGDWFYELRVWDVTNLSVSNDFELGGPTPVGRARVQGNDEQRASFANTLALDFDFVSGVSYVVTAELRTTSHNDRELDLYHTARLKDVVLTGGAQMNALSGHDYLAAVPEPQAVALWLVGLAGLGLAGRRRRGRG